MLRLYGFDVLVDQDLKLGAQPILHAGGAVAYKY